MVMVKRSYLVFLANVEYVGIEKAAVNMLLVMLYTMIYMMIHFFIFVLLFNIIFIF